jgi:Protein of unknown function (DUF3431)
MNFPRFGIEFKGMVGCCAQFFITKGELLRMLIEYYIRLREYLIYTPEIDYHSGRFFEFSYLFAFTGGVGGVGGPDSPELARYEKWEFPEMSKRSVNDLSRQTSSSKMDIQKDIMFKMSKKIAQLTKVIYYLNTKNEDTDLMMKNSAALYESELSETINDGAVIIQELQAKLKDAEIRMDMQKNMLKQNAESMANSEKKLKVAEEALHNAKEV